MGMQKEESRHDWIDVAKGIGILLVVYGHVARGVFNANLGMDPDFFVVVDRFIYSFHMPLFFFLSGIFFFSSLEKHGHVGLITIKIDSILYPYVIWSLVQGIFEVILSSYTNGHTTLSDVLSFAWQPRAQFWFLYCLFQIFLVVTLLQKINYRPPLVLISLLATTHLLVAHHMWPGSILRDAATYGIYFVIGAFSYPYIKKRLKPSGITLLLGLLLFGCVHFIQPQGFGTLPIALVSIFLVIQISMHLAQRNSKLLMKIGACSMMIYLAHVLFGSGVRILLKNAFGIEDITTHLLIGTFSGVVLSMTLMKFLDQANIRIFLNPPFAISSRKLGQFLTSRSH